MSEKTFKLNPGEELEISIRRRRQDLERIIPFRPKRGIIDPFSRDEFLPRRLQKTGGLQFYDLGQILVEGVWTDFVFRADRQISLVDNSIEAGELLIADTEARDDDLIAVGLENFSSKFRKITTANADKFQLYFRLLSTDETVYLYSDNDRWNGGDTVKFEDTDLSGGIVIDGSPFFAPFRVGDIGNSFNAKITGEFDYDADEVEYLVQKSDSFFLVPAFCLATAGTSGRDFAPTDRPDLVNADYPDYSFVEELYADYLTFPRVAMDDYINGWFNDGYQPFRIQSVHGYTMTLAGYIVFRAQSDYLKSIASTKFYKTFRRFIENTPLSQFAAVEETPTAEFPEADLFPAPPSIPNYIPGENRFASKEPLEYIARWSAITKSGALQAIIKQGENYFFVWKKKDADFE